VRATSLIRPRKVTICSEAQSQEIGI